MAKIKDQNRKHWFLHYHGKISHTAKVITFWAFSVLSILYFSMIYDTLYRHIGFYMCLCLCELHYIPVWYAYIISIYIYTVCIILLKTAIFFPSTYISYLPFLKTEYSVLLLFTSILWLFLHSLQILDGLNSLVYSVSSSYQN